MRRGILEKRRLQKVYLEYEKQMHANNALDFDDLLVKTVQLFQTQLDVLEKLSGTFSIYYGG